MQKCIDCRTHLLVKGLLVIGAESLALRKIIAVRHWRWCQTVPTLGGIPLAVRFNNCIFFQFEWAVSLAHYGTSVIIPNCRKELASCNCIPYSLSLHTNAVTIMTAMLSCPNTSTCDHTTIVLGQVAQSCTCRRQRECVHRSSLSQMLTVTQFMALAPAFALRTCIKLWSQQYLLVWLMKNDSHAQPKKEVLVQTRYKVQLQQLM